MKIVWPVKNFGEIAEFKNGLNFSANERGGLIKIIGVSDFQENFRISHQNLQQVEIEGAVPTGFLLKNRDLVFVRSNGSKALVGRCLLIENVTEPVTHSGFTIRARVNSRDVDSEFIGYFFQTSLARRAIATAGGGTNISNLSQDLLAAIPVPIPNLAEQLKIIAIIRSWERSVATVEELLVARINRKRGLMQQLLTGQTRFKEFKVERWEKLPAGTMFQNRSQRNDCGAPVLSVTQDQGIVLRESLDRRISADKENHPNYKLVRPGDFVISLRSFQGGLEYSPLKGAVSPAYHVITPKIGISAGFYRHYFKSYEFIERLAVTVIGIRDGKQISFGDFEFLKLPYPPVPEQKRIAAVLDTCDQEIELLQKQLDALKEQKRGLMQKLLTGKVRVKL